MSENKTMTIRLSLQERVDFYKIAKKAIAASDTSDKETALEILRGSEELGLDQQLKRLAEDGIEDLHLYFPKQVLFDGVEPPNRETFEAMARSYLDRATTCEEAQEQDASTNESEHKVLTVRLHLLKTLTFRDGARQPDMAKPSKQGGGGEKVDATDDVKASKGHEEGEAVRAPHSLICFGGRQPRLAGELKLLAKRGIPELELYFTEKLTWDGVDVPDGETLAALAARTDARLKAERAAAKRKGKAANGVKQEDPTNDVRPAKASQK